MAVRKIQVSQLSHSAGVISAYINGVLFQVSVGTLTANTLYMIYYTSAGLVISTNVNSVGPSGYSGWVLVGAFYSNGLSSVGFGAFIKDVNSPPQSETWDWLPTGAWTGNVTYTGKALRNKEFIELTVVMTCSAAPSPNVQQSFNNPTNITMDTTKANGSNFYAAGVGTCQDSGVNSRGCIMQSLGGIIYPYWINSITIDGVVLTLPFTWGAGDVITANYKFPVTGWTATPLKDL